MPNLSDVCEPVRRLTKKILSCVRKVSNKSLFKNVDETMQPVLRYFSNNLPVNIQCHSPTKNLVRHYFRKVSQSVVLAALSVLTQSEQRYAVIEKEVLTICFESDRYHKYLVYRDGINVHTDHKPFEIIFTVFYNYKRYYLHVKTTSLDLGFGI